MIDISAIWLDCLRKNITNNTVNVCTPDQQPEDGKINVLIDVNNTSDGKPEPNIHVINSHNIRKKDEIASVITVVMNSPKFDEEVFTRTKSSYVNEWIGHNRMYDISGILGQDKWRNSAEHVDLNNLENRMVIWDILSEVTW